MARLLGRLSRLDRRCIRLQHHDLHPDRHSEKLHGRSGARGPPRNRHADDAPGWRCSGWYDRRQMGPQASADAVGSVGFDLRVPERFFDVLYDAVRAARAVPKRHGRRMGGWYATRSRTLAHSVQGPGLWTAARWVVLGIPAVGGNVSVHLPALQRNARPGLASDVLDCHRARPAHSVDSEKRSGKSGVARATTHPARRGALRPPEAGTKDVVDTHLPEGPARHHHSEHSSYRGLHVRVLLGQLLVPDVPPGIGT